MYFVLERAAVRPRVLLLGVLRPLRGAKKNHSLLHMSKIICNFAASIEKGGNYGSKAQNSYDERGIPR